MFFRLHGLCVRSNVVIPGVVASDSSQAPDLDLTVGTGAPLEVTGDPDEASPWFASRGIDAQDPPVLVATWLSKGRSCRLAYRDGVTFVLDRAATRVWLTWPAPLTLTDTLGYLLGPITGLILRLRGITSLHASAVALDGRAVAFVAPRGTGKSTVAAAFAVRGVPVLSDDHVSLRRRGHQWRVAPGCPRLRLWPDAAGAVAPDGDGLIPPGPSGSTTRFHLDLTHGAWLFGRHDCPLSLIYLLERGCDATCATRDLRPAHALLQLVANTYGNGILDQSLRAREFDDLATLVRDVPVRALSIPDDLAAIASWPDQILALSLPVHGTR